MDQSELCEMPPTKRSFACPPCRKTSRLSGAGDLRRRLKIAAVSVLECTEAGKGSALGSLHKIPDRRGTPQSQSPA